MASPSGSDVAARSREVDPPEIGSACFLAVSPVNSRLISTSMKRMDRDIGGTVIVSVAELRDMITDAVREGAAPNAPPRFVKAAQLAELFGVSDRAIRDWTQRQGMPHIRIGVSEVRYDSDEVIAWARARGRRMESCDPASTRPPDEEE